MANIKKLEEEMRGFISDNYGDLGFEFEISKNAVLATAYVKYTNHDDDISIFLKATDGNIASATFMFDKLPMDYAALELLNKFNDEVFMVKASRSSEGYLVLSVDAAIESESGV